MESIFDAVTGIKAFSGSTELPKTEATNNKKSMIIIIDYITIEFLTIKQNYLKP